MLERERAVSLLKEGVNSPGSDGFSIPLSSGAN